MRNRLGRLSAGLVALGLLAAGCGDDAGGSVNEVSAETTAAPSTSEAAITTTTTTESARAEAGFAEADVQITLTWEGHGDLDLFATGPVEGAEPELVSEGRGNGGPPGGQVVPVADEDGGTGFQGDAAVRCGESGPVLSECAAVEHEADVARDPESRRAGGGLRLPVGAVPVRTRSAWLRPVG